MVSTYFIPPPSPSPNLRTFLAYCDAQNELDHVKMLDLLDDNFQHHTLPKSLGKPIRNKEQFEKTLTGVLPMFKAFRVILYEVVEAGDIITAHALSEGESVTGAPYAHDYMLTIHFVPAENGELPKMSIIKEFVDSEYMLNFFSEERGRVAAAAGGALATL